MRYRIINWILLLLILILFGNTLRSWMNLQKRGDIIQQTQDRLQQVKEENKKLQRQLAQVESQAYTEREARNKLNLGKDGEIVLILPSISPLIHPSPTTEPVLPNWKRWMKIFF